ncbi:hypothetical protein BDD12DRAFT_898307 [Trichophaea hybrida]|nr:hypothetical protein BDD12DRAFT_898307 [Trichophaea hybrida]
MADSDEVDYRSPSSDSEFTPPRRQQRARRRRSFNQETQSNHAEDRDRDVGSESNGEGSEGQPTSVQQSARGPPGIPNRARRGASEEEVYDFPDEDNDIFSKFADKIIAMAQDLVRQNSKYSTNEILEQSLNITIAAAKRLRINKLSGWQVAMREEKGLVATELKQPVSGKGYKGRKGFDGRYSQHVADVYQDPKRELYIKRAEEINEEGRVGRLTLLKSTQKKSLNRLTKFLHELAGNEVHLIVMAVPSNAKPILFTSAGFGGAYYKLIV